MASVQIEGVSKVEEESARRLLAQWTELVQSLSGPDGVTKVQSDVRYVSCLFWVLSARRLKGQQAEGSASDEPSMHLLLKTTNTPVFDFFLQTSQLGKLADSLSLAQEMLPNDETSRLLKNFTSVEVHFIIRVILFTKMKKIIEEIVPDAHRRASLHRATWLLFLNIQHEHKAFEMFPGFCLCVASLQAVLACDQGFDPCNFGETNDIESPERKAKYDAWSQALLRKACAEQSVIAEVQRAAVKVREEWHKLFGSDSGSASASKGEDKERKTKSADSVMAEGEIEFRCDKLSAELNDRLSSLALMQLDGRILLDSPHLVERKKVASPDKGEGGVASAAEVISGGTSSRPGSPSKFASLHQGLPGSPAVGRAHFDESIFRTPDRPTRTDRTALPATPISSMQKDHAWLSSFLEGAEGAEDSDLVRFLAACDTSNATHAGVVARADQLVDKLNVSQDVGQMGKRLYYRLLRDICLKEEERLKRSNFASLLKDEQMHRALLAFCFEIVLHVLSPVARPFPVVLRMTGVSEFELLVMIENINLLFELSNLTMSDGVRRHIRELQNRMVECEAWKRGSVLLRYLEEPELEQAFNKEASSAEILALRPSLQRAPHNLPPASPSRGAGRSSAMPPPESPLRVGARLPPRHPGKGKMGGSGGSGGGAAAAEQSGASDAKERAAGSEGEGTAVAPAAALPNIKRQLSAFARRFWLRAYHLLSYLTSRLRNEGMTNNAVHRANSVLQQMALSGCMCKLLPNRNLHQVLLCIIFGACKVEMQESALPFKTIITEHRYVFDAMDNDRLYWNVKVGDPEDKEVNVIEFYNTNFIQECKGLLCAKLEPVMGLSGAGHVTPPQVCQHSARHELRISWQRQNTCRLLCV